MHERDTEGSPAVEPYAVRFTQTAKGKWYIDKVEARGRDIEQVKKDMDELTKYANEKVEKLNKDSWT